MLDRSLLKDLPVDFKNLSYVRDIALKHSKCGSVYTIVPRTFNKNFVIGSDKWFGKVKKDTVR